MVANAPVDREEIEVEVDRYVGMPGQALAYKVGQREILRLRAEARPRSAPASPSPTSTTRAGRGDGQPAGAAVPVAAWAGLP